MKQLTLLIDNDVVIKLAQMAAYDDALAAIDTPSEEVGSLGHMLRYMGKTSLARRLAFMRDDASSDRLAVILKGIAEIEPTEMEVLTAAAIMKFALENELDLDEGEVGLIAVAIHRKTPDVATGDKRAIRSLPDALRGEASLKSVKGRLVCFEQIIARLCKKHGLNRVKKAVQAAPYADTTISQAFQEYGSRGAEVFTQLLDFLIREQIESVAPGWLKTYPP